MITLYDEQEVLHNYIATEVREGIREGRAQGIVGTYKELGMTVAEAVSAVVRQLGTTQAAAEELVKRLW